MEMNDRPANIVFDFGGVLMRHDREGCLQALRRILSEEDITNVLGYGNDRTDTLRHRFEIGQCSTQEFLSQVLSHSRQGTTAQQVVDAWNTIHVGIPDSVWPQLERLRSKGHRLYLMSNTDDIHWQHTLALYGDRVESLFDEVFLSFEEGMVKPDEAFFREVNRRTGAAPAWFVDDVAVNRLAAERCVGWRTCASVEELMERA